MVTTNPIPIKALIGLGNIGKEFANTYHNAGFLFLDFLTEGACPHTKRGAFGVGAWKEKRGLGFSYEKRHGMPPHQAQSIWCGGMLLIKPRGYMNESGRGALAALDYFKLKPEEVLLAHDDSDLAVGIAKLTFGGRAAGHHGVESVIKALGTKEFWRLKIGIRPSADQRGQDADSRGRIPRELASSPRMKAGEFVLTPIKKEDRAKLARLFQRVSPVGNGEKTLNIFEPMAQSFKCT
ncbi:MAG: aminoacyl-tRNA hydrolase [bacterium]|nr:aminoacyl-tRNA hydrolase [bacterium]